MGLEVREKQEKMEKVARPSSKDSIVVISADARTKAYLRFNPGQQKLMKQLDQALEKECMFQANIHSMYHDEKDGMTSSQRDAAVNGLRLLHIFYGFSPETFALAVNLFDRFLSKVKVRPKYLSCISTSCYYIAAKIQEEDADIPGARELITITQCGGKPADLMRMERLILEKLQWQLNAVTSLTFLELFYAMLETEIPDVSNTELLNTMIAKLQLSMCQSKVSCFRAQTLALAVFSNVLQETHLLGDIRAFQTVIEIQDCCKVSDCELQHCCNAVTEFLEAYCHTPSKKPKIQLAWTLSRRTFSQLRPSYLGETDLPTIQEDQDCDMLETSDGQEICYTSSEDDGENMETSEMSSNDYDSGSTYMCSMQICPVKNNYPEYNLLPEQNFYVV